MKIICAGPSRTGTKSFSASMRHFGFIAYEYEENFFYHAREWMEILQGGHTPEMFRKMYENVDVVADLPAFYFWEEILEAFPDAKVVYMDRDDDAWFESWKMVNDVWATRQLFYQIQPYFSPTAMRFRDTLEATLCFYCGYIPGTFPRPWRQRQTLNERMCKKRYREHLERVKERAAREPERFLKFNMREGWEPLCKFIGKEVPDIPYPHLNKGADMINRMVNQELDRVVNRETIKTLFFISFGVFTTSYFAFFRNKGTAFDWLNFKTNKILNMFH